MTEPQLDLFGISGSTPASRRTDPESSHLAEKKLRDSGALSHQRQQVLEAVRRMPGSTAREMAEACGLCRYLVSRRLPELRAVDLVYNLFDYKANKPVTRKCRVGGNPSVVWIAHRERK